MLNGNGNRGGLTAPLYYVRQVTQKIRDGTYRTIPTRCICGGESDTVLTEFDRYMIPHRMVMCEECCLIRANPRMTDESYREFYNNEYLPIYDGFEAPGRTPEELFQNQVTKGREIQAFIKDQELDFPVKSVIDFGGGRGGSLIPFQEAGCSVLNVDINEKDRAFALGKGIPSIARLEGSDAKADLIILQDVIEHLSDLSYIAKIGRHLNKGGKFFIYTPGLFACSPSKLFQNAHTYQFIADTLEYVMFNLGYVPDFLDEQCVSLWNSAYDADKYAEKPRQWRQYILEHLHQTEKRAIPPIRTRSRFSTRLMLDHLKANLSRKLPELTQLKDQFSGSAVIIGGGPSVDGQLEKISELKAAGSKVFAIDRMYSWTLKNGIEPDFVVLLDSDPDVVAGFQTLGKNTIHLVVANGLPEVFSLLQDARVYLLAGGINVYPEARSLWVANGYKKIRIVATGGSVTLSCLNIALTLGFRNLHIFGFDCMVPDAERTYASGITGTSLDRRYYEIEVGDGGRLALTCTSFLAFAQQFFRMVETARQWGMLDSVDVYGESLVNLIWEEKQKQEFSQWPIPFPATPICSTP